MKVVGFVLAATVTAIAAAAVFTRLVVRSCGYSHAALDAQRAQEAEDLEAAWSWLA